MNKSSHLTLGLIVGALTLSGTAWAQDATVEFGGRVMLDYTTADLNDPDISINDTEVRRARLFAKGKFGKAISYKFEVNKTTGSSVELTDAYLQFAPENTPFKIKVGQYKTHNSLDELNSSRFISTLERSALTDAFSLDRRLSVSLSASGDNYTFDVGAHTTNLEDEVGPDEGHAYSARATFNPVKTDETIVHLGASWRYRKTGDDESDLRYRQRPYTHVAPDRIINTGRFAKSDNFFGAEAAVFHNNLWAAGEYSAVSANGAGANPDADFSGFYGEVGAFFGGKRTYKSGKFGRPKVDTPLGEGGYGAVSVVARYDSIDLQDSVYLGKLDTIVLGADWWPTKYTRLGINYFDADAENGSAAGGSGIVSRVQFDF